MRRQDILIHDWDAPDAFFWFISPIVSRLYEAINKSQRPKGRANSGRSILSVSGHQKRYVKNTLLLI